MIVELEPELRRVQVDVPRRIYRRQGYGALLLGAMFPILAMIGAIGALTNDEAGDAPVQVTIGMLTALVGVPFLVGGGWIVRSARGGDPDDLLPGLSYAFAVIEGQVIFPALRARPAEHWPLSESRVTVGSSMGATIVRLACPGRRPRAFSASSLAVSPAEIEAAVHADGQRRVPADLATDVTLPLQVELAGWATVLPQPRDRRLQGARGWRFVLGVLGLAAGVMTLVVAAAWALILGGSAWVGAIPGFGFGVIVAVLGVFALRGKVKPAIDPQPAFLEGPPYAMRLEGRTLSFPAAPGRPAESWPLDQTKFNYYESGETGLEVSCLGKSTRQFGAGSLALPPRVVLAQLELRRAEPDFPNLR